MGLISADGDLREMREWKQHTEYWGRLHPEEGTQVQAVAEEFRKREQNVQRQIGRKETCCI